MDITSPPMTARPSGACIWLPFSSASAIGTMPTVIAQAVIRIGRSRSLAPRIDALTAGTPFFQCSSMNVTSMTEFDTDTPRDMIEPMNDSMFSDVLVKYRITAMPASTPGTAPTEIKASRERLEIRRQQDEDHEHGDAQADRQRLEHLVHRRELAHGLHPHAAGRLAGGVERLLDLGRGPAHVLALDVGRQESRTAATCRGRPRRAGRPAAPSPRRGSSG